MVLKPGFDVDGLFRGHGPALRRYLFRLTGDLDLADDALQETFVKALARPPGDGRNVRGWLYSVATNVVRDEARRATRAAHLDADRVASSVHGRRAAATPEDHAERRDVRARLMAALDTLSPRERTAVLMREEGFSHREIAEALDTTTGTIGTLLARSLDKLARALSLDGDVG